MVVHGLVQGVFFRDTCRREAGRLGVTGWVGNCSDGSVAAVFEGRPDAVDAMLDWARTGPPQASVAGVEVIEEEPEGERDFRVV